MTPGIQAPRFFLLLLVPVLTAPPITPSPMGPTTSGHTSPSGNTQTVTARSSPMSSHQLCLNIVPLTSSNHSLSFFFLSFRILNLPFNSSLEDPSTNYYQVLQRNVTEWILQIYKQENFLGSSNVKFRPGSVVVESTLAFREGTTNANQVAAQFLLDESHEKRYSWVISRLIVDDVSFPSSSRPGSGVPGWGIALLVLVCVLVALAIIYLIALAVCQCRRKSCGQLDLFPTRDAYHPMSEYPTYHTHGRYVPPGTKRSPYEEVSAGNGGSSLSYTNPAATSANL
uniref:Mucin-1 n=1 Tax=Myotis myotis TaxID=51298 RepID=A0A7J7SRT9_MYOMY|nr:mucin 1, cell surface associated [Myotis myotis]